MEFLASLAIKAFIGTSVCGTITVGTIYTCDKTLLGFEDNTKTTSASLGQNGSDKASIKSDGEAQTKTEITSNDASAENSETPGTKVTGSEGKLGADITTDNTAVNPDNSSIEGLSQTATSDGTQEENDKQSSIIQSKEKEIVPETSAEQSENTDDDTSLTTSVGSEEQVDNAQAVNSQTKDGRTDSSIPTTVTLPSK